MSKVIRITEPNKELDNRVMSCHVMEHLPVQQNPFRKMAEH